MASILRLVGVGGVSSGHFATSRWTVSLAGEAARASGVRLGDAAHLALFALTAPPPVLASATSSTLLAFRARRSEAAETREQSFSWQHRLWTKQSLMSGFRHYH